MARPPAVAGAGRRARLPRHASHGARQIAGSRLPCTARPARPGARATSSGTRQSTPTTSAPAVGHQPEQLAGADPEVDAGHAEVGERHRRPAGWRAARSARSRRGVSAPAQQSNSWTAWRAGVDLGPQRGEGQVGQAVEELVPQAGVAVHERLGAGVGPRRSALDEVARHRERSAGEADQRDVELARRGRAPSRARRACRASGSSGRRRSRSAADGTAARPPGPTPGAMSTPKPMAATGTTMSRVEDGGVDAVAAHRLQGDLGGQVGVADGVEDRCPSPRSARYSGSERPAWRMNHTGVRLAGSPRQARRKRGRLRRSWRAT